MVVVAVVHLGIRVCRCSRDHGYEALVRNDLPPIPFTKLCGEYVILALVSYIILYFIFTTPVLYLLHITS